MPKVKIHSFEEINQTRRKVRRIILLISIPFLAIICLFGYKVYEMNMNAEIAAKAYAEKNYGRSIEASKKEFSNFFEPWLAHYNAGTAYAGNKDYDNAADEFKTALTLTDTEANVCKIDSNLAIVYEKQGDEATKKGDQPTATEKYSLSLQVISGAPKGCFPPPPPPEGSKNNNKAPSGSGGTKAGEEMNQTKERVNKKLNPNDSGDPSNNPGQTPSPTPQPQPSEDPNGQEQVKKQLEDSNSDRTNKENSERGDTGGQPTTDTDKPW